MLIVSSNNLMWRSHLYADPPNAPLFYGPFATDSALYTDRILEGFDAWMGVGQILIAPQLFEGGLTREVYFPMASPDDHSLYFDLHAPFGTHKAGGWGTIATPIEHGGMFAREGAMIPIGKKRRLLQHFRGPREHIVTASRWCSRATAGRSAWMTGEELCSSRAIRARRTLASGLRMTESPLCLGHRRSRCRTAARPTWSKLTLTLKRMGSNRCGRASFTLSCPSGIIERCQKLNR